MGYQVPKSNHPWRQYPNKINNEEKKETKHYKLVKIFVEEIAECWDTITITSTAMGNEDRVRLSELPQSKQASWLVSMLRKYYESY